MLDRGLRRGFDAAVDREAAAAGPDPSTPRRDLRELETFTVDPASARDFDDAISAQELGPGQWRVWVHIADVAAHVPPGSLVDREARRRATSVYVPGAVEPMLPEALSNVACSLVPGEERPAVTVELDLRGARTERVAFHRSLIRSDARLDYDRVDRIFAGAEAAQEPWAAPLAAARAVAAELDRARAARGALAVETVEPEFVFDLVGRVEALRPTQQTESHRLIEHLMIAANEAVATLLEERKLPALYRVHERPEPQRVQFLVAQLASLDVATPALPDHLSPQQAGDAAAECSRLVDEHVRRTGQGRRGADRARAALAQAGPLQPGQPRARRPALAALLPLHLAHPPLPRPRLPPRAAGGRGRRRASSARLGDGGTGFVDLGARARRDAARARRRRRRPLLPARVRAVPRRLAARLGGRGRGADRRGSVRGLRRGSRGPAAGAPAARRVVGAQRGGDDPARDEDGQGTAPRRPGARAGRARGRAPGRVDLLPVEL